MSNLVLAEGEELSRPLLDSSGAKQWCHGQKGTCLVLALAMVLACTVSVALAQQPWLNSMKELAVQEQSSLVRGIEDIPNLTDAKPWVKKNFEACMVTFWGWAPISSYLSKIAIHNEEKLCACAAIASSTSDADSERPEDADFQNRLDKVLDCRWLIHADNIADTACFAEACPSAVKDDSH
ncbi:unnamed protein product [Symbiodinium natans]|uniref:Uncharacterized protein n=1 Tax=Symbiodinium natans TaxID=878477 RepID=A0A812IX96_9DINO|nr:unnamed protein product [Symbiodinium natans]